MSEDQPKQPPAQPEQTAPNTSSQPETNAIQTDQAVQQAWVKVQPVLKAQSIKILRGTIGLLEGIVEKLENAPPPQVSAKPSLLGRVLIIWKAILGRIRTLLPASVNQKLPDWGLTGAIATIAFLIFWTTTNLGQSKPTQVATQPPEVQTSPPAVTIPSSEETPPIVATTPSEEEPVSTAISAPAELEAPAAPTPVEIAPPPPPPPPVLTPEQSLIASIQNQVNEITTGYGEGIIQSIQANFPGSLLSVKVGDAWYSLSESQQDKLASQVLQRSKDLEFSKLEITDSQGRLVARNPLVGDNMVILQRRLLTATS